MIWALLVRNTTQNLTTALTYAEDTPMGSGKDVCEQSMAWHKAGDKGSAGDTVPFQYRIVSAGDWDQLDFVISEAKADVWEDT